MKLGRLRLGSPPLLLLCCAAFFTAWFLFPTLNLAAQDVGSAQPSQNSAQNAAQQPASAQPPAQQAPPAADGQAAGTSDNVALPSAAPPRSRPAASGFSPKTWQFALGYQYNRISVRGTFKPFSTNGVNLSATRFFGRGFGVEGQVGSGFGTAAPGDSMWSLFAGGGPKFAIRSFGHVEPWAHGILGAEHFHFAQPFPFAHTSLAWLAGGGIDYRLDNGFSLRAEGDYLGTKFGGAFQRNVQIAGALVWNF